MTPIDSCLPPIGICVAFYTHDGQKHIGETMEVSGAGPLLCHQTVFFERLDGKRRIYFTEEVREWEERPEGRTHLPYKTELFL